MPTARVQVMTASGLRAVAKVRSQFRELFLENSPDQNRPTGSAPVRYATEFTLGLAVRGGYYWKVRRNVLRSFLLPGLNRMPAQYLAVNKRVFHRNDSEA